jgi:hypothetical protein
LVDRQTQTDDRENMIAVVGLSEGTMGKQERKENGRVNNSETVHLCMEIAYPHAPKAVA